MLAKLRELIGIGRPGGLDDLLVRVVKTAVAAGAAAAVAIAFDVINGDVAIKAAVFVVLTAAATAAINALQLAVGTSE
jgi:hypothetical protein